MMLTTMIEATDRNMKILNCYHNIQVIDFCGWLYVKGNKKDINKINKKFKVIMSE